MLHFPRRLGARRGSLLAAAAIVLVSAPARAEFNLAQSTGLFTPSYRGEANASYFGWDTFGVDGAHIDNPPADIGTNDPLLTLTQESGEFDHISGSGNIYTGQDPLDLHLTAVSSGTVGSGFTTLIIQGATLFGGFGGDILSSDIAGVTPEVVQNSNLAGAAQFWVKYELPGNEATYAIDLGSTGSSISLDKLVVDVLWSPDGYATDSAIVPEPSSWLLAASGAVAAWSLSRRRAVR